MTATRRLAAILAADVAGYSRLIGADEGGTLQVLKAGLIDPTITAYNGRLVKTPGDWLLVEFGSVVDALRCATEVEAGMGSQRTLRWRDMDSNFRFREKDGRFGYHSRSCARLRSIKRGRSFPVSKPPVAVIRDYLCLRGDNSGRPARGGRGE